MSNVIDSKVVEMLFDNKQFESGVQTSLSTLDKLKKSLNMDGVANGLDEIASSAKNLSFGVFGESVVTVTDKFSALEQVAIGALRRIGEQAVEAGEKFIASLSVDQITSGWEKYAEKTSSVQTIMAATRKEFAGAENQMELVNEQLDRLNWFTDETSYNFLDMVNNVGKFTSNNIRLEDSIKSMQGISTWAAISGANTQEASRAMYNLSQAISVGYVKLMDWKSIENANMATAEFKETALETAVALGTLTKTADGMYQTIDKKTKVSVEDFNTALSEGWFSKDVLLKTLDQYGSFANKLYDYTQETKMYTSELLGYADDYAAGTLDISAAVKETGISSERLTEILEDLNDAEYEIGRRAFKAAQEAKTFEEAIKSVKDATSTAFMSMFETIFGNYEEAKVLWTDLANSLYDVFVEPVNSINDSLSVALKKTTVETYLARMTNLSETAATNLYELAKSAGVNSDEFKNLTAELFDANPEMATLVSNLLNARIEMEGMEEVNLSAYIKQLTGASDASIVSLRALGLSMGYDSEQFEEAALRLAGGNEELAQLITNLVKMQAEIDGISGREKLIEAFWNLWEYAGKLVEPIKEAFHEMFPINLAESIFNIADSLLYFTRGLEVTEEQYAKIKTIAKSLFSLVNSFKDVWGFIRKVIEPLKEAFHNIFPIDLANIISSITEKVTNFTQSLDVTSEQYEKLRSIFEGVFSIVKMAKDLLKAILIPITDLLERLKPLGPMILDLAAGWGDWLTELSESGKAAEFFTETFTRVSKVIQRTIDFISEFFSITKTVESYLAGGGGIAGVFEVIGDKVSNIVGFVVDQISNITGIDLTEKKGNILSFIENVKEKVVAFLPDQEKLTAGFQKLKDILEKIKKPFVTVINYVKEKLDAKGYTSFRDILDSIKEKLSGVATAFEPLKKVFEAVKKLASALWGALKKLGPVIGTIIDSLGSMISSLTIGLAEFLNKLDFSNILSIVNGGIGAGIGVGIMGFLTNLKSIVGENGVGGFIGKLKDTLDSLKGTLVAYQESIKADTLKKIAVAVGILAASIFVVAMIDSDRLIGAVSALSIMLVELESATKSLSKLPKVKASKILGMVGVAVSLFIVAAALKKVSDVPWEGIWKGVVAFGLVMAEIVIVLKNLPNGTKALPGAIAMGIMAVALVIIAQSLKPFEEISWDGVWRGVVAFGLIMAEIVIVLKNLPNGTKSLPNAIAMGIMAVALVIIAQSLKPFEEMSWDGVLRGVVAFGTIMAEIAVVLNSMPNGTKSLPNAMAMIIMSVALVIIAQSLKPFGEMSWDGIWRGIVAFGFAMAEIAVAINSMPNGTKSLPNAIAMGIMAAALLIVANTLSKIANLSWEGIGKGIAAMAIALAEIVIALKVLNGSSLAGAAAILIVSAALLVLVPVLKALGSMSWEEIGKGLLTIAGVFAVLAVAGYLLGPVVVVLVALAAALALIGVAAVAFGVAAVAFGVGLMTISLALTSFSVSAEVLANGLVTILNTVITALPTLLGNLATSLDNSIPALITMFTDILFAALESIRTLIPAIVDTVLTILSEVLTSLAANIQPIIEGLIGVIVGVIRGLAAGVPEMISATIEIFTAIMDALGGAFNGLDPAALAEAILSLGLLTVAMGLIVGIAAMALVATLTLPTIGTNLSNFIQNVTPFIEGVKTIDTAAMEGAKALAETVLILTAAGVLDGLTAWFTGGNSMVNFGKQLTEFAPYLVEYSNTISGIDSEVVQASANAALALATMAQAIPNEGGVWSLLAGDNSLATFAKELKPFGEALVEYSNVVSGNINLAGITTSVLAGSLIFSMASNLPDQGGVVGWFMGDNDLATLAEGLEPFGTNLAKYSDAVTGKVNIAGVLISVMAATAIFDMAEGFPDQGGVVGWFMGDNDLATLAGGLESFGTNLAKYSDAVKGKINIAGVMTSVMAAKMIFGMAEGFPDQGGVVGWFMGDNDLATLAGGLESFGTNLAKYSDAVKGKINIAGVMTSVMAAKAIFGITEDLPEQGGVISWFTGDKSLATAAKDLSKFGENISEYSDKIKNVNTAKMGDVATQFKNLVDLGKEISSFEASRMSSFINAMKEVASSGVDDFVKTIKDAHNIIRQAASEMLDVFSAAILSTETKVVKSGETVMTYLKSGLISYKKYVIETAVDIVTEAANAMHSVEARNIAYSAGRYFGDGFVSGLKSKTQSAKDAASNLGKAAANSLNSTLQINSPSKVGEKSGGFFGLGFVNKLIEYSDKAYDAASQIGKGAMDGLNRAISSILEGDSGIDDGITIRPVIDLTDVQNGVDQIYGMTRGLNGFAIAGSVDLASSAQAAMNRQDSDQPNESGLDKLTKAVEKLVDRTSRPNQTNHFNVSGADADEIVDKLMDRITTEFKREESEWD